MSELPLERRPKLEMSFRNSKLKAEEPEAIEVVRRPIWMMAAGIALGVPVAAFSLHPVNWGQSLVAWLTSL
jgi:hypothetical protein